VLHWPEAIGGKLVFWTHQFLAWLPSSPSLQYQPKGQSLWAAHTLWHVSPEPDPSSMHAFPAAQRDDSHAPEPVQPPELATAPAKASHAAKATRHHSWGNP